jgi:hypothetical protein
MDETLKKLLQRIIKDNPQVDLKRVLEGHRLTEGLRGPGRRRRGYRLALPSSQKRVSVNDDGINDHRTIHLHQF